MPDPHPRFLTTRWSLVAAAGDSERAREALGELAQTYWFPLYAFARHLGVAPHEAEDVVQSFFARLLETHDLARVVRGEARFRSFLRAALRNFVANRRAQDLAEKRGGGRVALAIDLGDAESRFVADQAGREVDPEIAFERTWARELVARALANLADEYRTTGRGDLHAVLQEHLYATGDGADGAARAGLEPGAFRVAVHRLRRRFRDALLQEVADTVRDPGEAAAELDAVLRALAAPDPREDR
ncbi:MAG: sigma-70 family RNA polymerase sigma factor [Planctomycetota bacterium]|nr:sigma-70 family RNA polymerase sigma factor [Planctomycetota bacterium]